MPLILDPQTEQRIQHEADLRHLSNPSELIQYALDALSEQEQDFLLERQAIRASIEEGLEQLDSDETVPSRDIEKMFAEWRSRHTA